MVAAPPTWLAAWPRELGSGRRPIDRGVDHLVVDACDRRLRVLPSPGLNCCPDLGVRAVAEGDRGTGRHLGCRAVRAELAGATATYGYPVAVTVSGHPPARPSCSVVAVVVDLIVGAAATARIVRRLSIQNHVR